MKSIKHIKKTILVFVLSLFSMAINAQKVEFESINISSTSLKIDGGNLVFSNNSTVLILESSFKLKGTDTEVPFVMIELRGKIKGKEQTFSTDVVSINKSGKIEQKLTINASNDNPIYISDVTINILNNKKLIASTTESLFSSNNKKTSFAILLNGINANDYCEYQEVKKVFYKESVSFGIFAVVIGLNNSKKEPILLEKILTNGGGKLTGTYIWTESHDKRTTRTVPATLDQNGNWFFKDSIKVGKDTPQLVGFQMEYITACKDSFFYNAIYTKEIKNNKKYSKFYAMEGGQRQIYSDIGGTSQTYLTWRPRISMPNTVTINSTGNLVIKDNAKLTIGLINLNIGKNKNQHRIKRVHSSWNRVNEVLKTGEVIKKTSNKNYTFTHEWNEKTMQYEALINFEGSEKEPVEISEIIITVVTENKDTFIYEYEGKYGTSLDNKTLYLELKKTEKIKYTDPCKTKYKLKEIEYSENNYNGVYTYQFWLKFENNIDIPDHVNMVIEIKDCSGKSQFVKITLKYDEKTKMFVGSQAITASKDCKLELVYGEIGAYNACDDETAWSFKTSESKNNGKGTRVVATTTNGTPGLL